MNNKRISYGENAYMILYDEVNGICPICTDSLLYEKGARNKKLCEIAHIYPLNPTLEQKELLKDEELLSNDPNHLDNLMLLCKKCHKKFDNPRTKEEYIEMVNRKKKLKLNRLEKNNWFNYRIEEEIIEIIDLLSQDTFVETNFKFKYNPSAIDMKLNKTITFLIKRDIKRDIEDYYQIIKDKFKEYDSLQYGTFKIMANQVNTYYISLAKKTIVQEDIFNSMVSWLYNKTNKKSQTACRIIISFFIQNCEVFDVISK